MAARQPRRVGLGWSVVAAAALLLAATAAGPGSSHAANAGLPLETAIVDPFGVGGKLREFSTVRALGATKVSIMLNWSETAPVSDPGPSFHAADPSDPHYRWGTVDREVEQAVRAGLDPILQIASAPAPSWAQLAPPRGYSGPSNLPNPTALAAFARAAAIRYSAHFEGLPRVRYWEAWNEPNLGTFLAPQLYRAKPIAPGVYARMVNALAAAVKAVNPDNLVIAGALAPFRDLTPETHAQDKDWGPLSFMRSLLCVSRTLRPTCGRKVRFDIWSTHPYTSGGPTHKAELPNDVSLGDLPKMRALLDAAVQADHVVSRGTVGFWVTEFSWDSNPPDSGGVPTRLLKRWVPQALYEMWRDGVSLVTWFSLRDQPMQSSPYQAGLFYEDGRPKPYLEGFRFPLVAFPRASGVYVWGRTPSGETGRVLIEQRSGQSGWKRLGIVKTDRYGIFQQTFRASRTGWVRGRLVGTSERTLAFSLKAAPDHFYNPFGSQESNSAAGR